MEISKSTNNDFPVLALSGRFDAHEVGPVRAWFLDQIDAGQVNLIIDLKEVNFIDSSALSTLVQGLKHCREKYGKLVLCSFQQPVRVIFELTRLDKAFKICADQAEARHYLQTVQDE